MKDITKDLSVFAQTGYCFILSVFYARSGDLHSQHIAVDLTNISGATLQYDVLFNMSKRAVASGPQ